MEYGEDVDLFWRVKESDLGYIMDQDIIVKTIHPSTIYDLFKQRFHWGMGYAQLKEKHPDATVKQIESSFLLTSLTLLSALLVIFDVRLIAIFLFLGTFNFLRTMQESTNIVRRVKKYRFLLPSTLINSINLIAYYLGYHYWKFLEFIGRRKKLERWH
jgi:hypothetical protein